MRITTKNPTTKALMLSMPILGASILLGAGSALTQAPSAKAQSSGVACYRINSESPDFDDVANPHGSQSSEVWCYRPVEGRSGATYIYNIDSTGQIRPELTAIAESDGTLTHASLLGGKLTVHRLARSNYNPLGIPLAPPEGAPRVPAAEASSMNLVADKSLGFLLTEPQSTEDISVRGEGNFTAQVRATNLPWRGYWWPYKSGRMHLGTNSPLAKYDRFVKARTGTSPNSQSWEKANHKYTGLVWQGHCNGWAAASILRAQPRGPIRDSLSRVTFSVSDLKGLYSEKDKCIKLAFFGKRYNGKRGDDLKDIYAGEFHNTLTYYIGRLNKAIALDYMQGTGIDNNVMSGYTMKIRRVSNGVFDVDTTATIHKYDAGRVNSPAAAPSYKKLYKYRIWVDADGLITKSVWRSRNPDFLWVPLAPNSCHTSNPRVTEEWLQQIVRQR